MNQFTDNQCVSTLKQHKWQFYNSAEAGLLPDGRIQRYIEGVPHDGVDALVRFLRRFVDVSNYEADSSINYAYCTGPQVDARPRTGNWRHVDTRMERVDNQGRVGPDGSNWRIVQTLAEGFITTLEWADARLVGGVFKPGDTGNNEEGERTITLRWVGVDPDLALDLARVEALSQDGLQTAQPGHRAVGKDEDGGNSIIFLHNLAGDDYAILKARATLADDGSGTIEVDYAQPEYRLTGFRNVGGVSQYTRLYIWDCPEGLAQTIIFTESATGKSCDLSYGSREGLVNIVVDTFDQASSNIPTTSYEEAPHRHGESTFTPHATSPAADPGAQSVGTVAVTRNRATPQGTYETVVSIETQDATDTGWFNAGSNEDGTIQMRVATGQTEANAETIANTAPATGYNTRGSVSGPDRFGHYSVIVTAIPQNSSFSSTPGYKSYSFSVSGTKTQWTNVDGVPYKRSIPITHYYAGNTSENSVSSYVGGSDREGVRVTPNGRGEYFQGYSYKTGTPGSWSADDTGI